MAPFGRRPAGSCFSWRWLGRTRRTTRASRRGRSLGFSRSLVWAGSSGSLGRWTRTARTCARLTGPRSNHCRRQLLTRNLLVTVCVGSLDKLLDVIGHSIWQLVQGHLPVVVRIEPLEERPQVVYPCGLRWFSKRGARSRTDGGGQADNYPFHFSCLRGVRERGLEMWLRDEGNNHYYPNKPASSPQVPQLAPFCGQSPQ